MGRRFRPAAAVLAVLLACCARAFALDPSLDVSQYAHTSWKVRDGFVKGIITSIAQTPDGYLWLGTEYGLLRFDGVRAVPWQPPEGEQLPSSVVSRLLAVRDGTLWIGTLKGLASWKGGKLTHHPELDGQTVDSLLQDRQGTVWAGTYSPAAGGLCAIRGGKAQCYGEDGSIGYAVFSLFEDSRGNLWAGTANGVWRWKPGPPKFYPMPPTPNGIEGMTESDDGTLLVPTGSGFMRIADGKVEAYPIPGIEPPLDTSRLLRDRDGSLWIGTSNGLLHLHQGKIDAFTRRDGLSSDYVGSLFEDREGTVWVANPDGLNRFREFAIPSISVDQGLSGTIVWAVLATNDGSVWLGSSVGLNRWDKRLITIYRKRISKDPDVERKQRFSQSGAANGRVREVTDRGLPNDAVQSLFQDDRGRIWVSTHSGVAWFVNGRFIPAIGLPAGHVHSIAEGRAGDLWFSYELQGLLHLSQGNVVEQIPWARLGHKDNATVVAADPMLGGLWIGFSQGGLTYFKDGRILASYAASDGLGHGRINDLQPDRNGTLWAATEGGLSRVKDGRITTLSSKYGLPCDAVNWSMEDDARSVWLSMPCGLVRIARGDLDAWAANPNRTIHVTVFDDSDGARSQSRAGGYTPHVGRSKDGKLWFATWDGVSVIDPQHLAFNKLPPPVHIEQVTADGKTYWQNSSGDALSAHPRLPPLVRDLTIDYTALSLVVPEKVHFRFKLEGQDKDWREVVNDRRVEYSNLPPRNYRFRVMACNNSGVWNEEGASLDFTIDPAYWQTNWFRALCVLTLLALTWTIYHLRVRALEHRQALLERHQAEIRALNEQMIKAQEAERIRISGELHDGVLQRITSLTLRLGTVKYQVPPDSEAKSTIAGLQQELINIGTDVRHVSHELHPALLQESGLPAALSAYCDEFSKVRGLLPHRPGSARQCRQAFEGKED